jgi:site-specific recombinase XerD
VFLELSVVPVKSFYRVLGELDEIAYDPARRLSLVRVPPRLPPPVMNVATVARLLDAIDPTTPIGARDRALYELLYATGMRASEVLGIEVGDLDLDERLCRIRSGKGGKQRVVPFGAVAHNHLNNYLRWVRPTFANCARGPAARGVWLNPNGRRPVYETIRHRLAGHARAADVERRVMPHGLRHACATHMLENGAELRHLQELLGHSSVQTTQIYTHLSVAHLKQVLSACHPRERGAEAARS